MKSLVSILTTCITLLSATLHATHTAQGQYRGSFAPEKPIALSPGKLGWRKSGLHAIRGVTIGPIESSLQPQNGYGTKKSAELLDELKKLHTNWVAITPYGTLWNTKSTKVRMRFEAPYAQNRIAVRKMIHQAKQRNMQVLVIPHLWLEQGGFRLHIDPGSSKRWKKLLQSYREFILAWAKDAAQAGADMFAIGQECHAFSYRFPKYWSTLIRDVRKVFPGWITYSANWYEEPHDVIFWEDLDLIGINAFYELGWDKNNAYEHQIKAQEAMQELALLAEIYQKPIFFTELGYTSRRNSTRQPHAWPEDIEQAVFDEAEQIEGFRHMLNAFATKPWFNGLFIWRYYSNIDDVSQEPPWGFSPHGKAAEGWLQYNFSQAWAADPN